MKFLSVISLIVSAVLAVFVYQNRQANAALVIQLQAVDSKNQELQAELSASRDEIAFLNDKILSMENTSLSGIADKANDAFLDGWESLIGIVGQELEQARKTIEEQRQGGTAKPGPEQRPNNSDT
ncbi:MAG: hypothetical protein OIF35_10685 [Cellvibrionaceae bacterium]|nr:hypothetical protein [Cellvibrionaceae bacterium]MCV6626624.1 hypothetical protein [Cellvibrionaceae bacterium]